MCLSTTAWKPRSEKMSISMHSASGSSKIGSSRIHDRPARQRVARDDRHELGLDDVDDANEQLGMLQLVAVEPPHQFLPRVQDDLLGQRQRAQPVVRARLQFQRALVLQLLENVGFDFFDRPFGIDEVVVIDVLQRLQRVPGLLL